MLQPIVMAKYDRNRTPGETTPLNTSTMCDGERQPYRLHIIINDKLITQQICQFTQS
jgi:hypothetical protein